MRGFHRSLVCALPVTLCLAVLGTTGLLVALATDAGGTALPGLDSLAVTAAIPAGQLAAVPCDERLGIPPCQQPNCDTTCKSGGFGSGVCLLNCCLCL